jgi:hypothetical protein
VLERCNNNKRQACRVLDISYHTLQAYLRYTPTLRTAQRALKAADPAPDDSPAAPLATVAPPVIDATLVTEEER